MRWVAAACFLTIGYAAADKELTFIGARAKYWAFQKVVRPPVPELKDNWIRTPIDSFILDELRKRQLSPSPAAKRSQLLRRVTYDLTGLPPTPEEVSAFLKDKSPDAYEKVVDRLLASPHYGERWASKWLDIVRYADTNGFELDKDRPHAWRYRDYVIASFNHDKPYDRFIQEQIAGDEMFPGNKEALIATGYLRAGSEHIVGGQHRPRRKPPGGADRNRHECRPDVSGDDGQLRSLPQPQVRSDSAGRFLRLQAVFAGAKGKDVEIATPAEKAAWEAAEELTRSGSNRSRRR